MAWPIPPSIKEAVISADMNLTFWACPGKVDPKGCDDEPRKIDVTAYRPDLLARLNRAHPISFLAAAEPFA